MGINSDARRKKLKEKFQRKCYGQTFSLLILDWIQGNFASLPISISYCANLFSIHSVEIVKQLVIQDYIRFNFLLQQPDHVTLQNNKICGVILRFLFMLVNSESSSQKRNSTFVAQNSMVGVTRRRRETAAGNTLLTIRLSVLCFI